LMLSCGSGLQTIKSKVGSSHDIKEFGPSGRIDGFYNLIIKLSEERTPSQRWEINFIFFLNGFSSPASCLFFSPTCSTEGEEVFKRAP